MLNNPGEHPLRVEANIGGVITVISECVDRADGIRELVARGYSPSRHGRASFTEVVDEDGGA